MTAAHNHDAPTVKGARVPRATYRVQFNRGFPFDQAAEIVPYLADLGIGDLYASPLFRAVPDSTHGYDICSFGELNPDLGGEQAFYALSAELSRFHLGLLLDMVPNHMGNDLTNAWWVDVLEHGPRSPYAEWFDIDWSRNADHLRGKVLLPILEDHYASELQAGKLGVTCEDGRVSVAYGKWRFPLAPHSLAPTLEDVARRCDAEPAAREAVHQLRTCVRVIAADDGAAGRAELAAARRHLAHWMETCPEFKSCMQAALAARNKDLHALLQQQHYRLAFWRVGPEEINYRRFFDVTQLVSLRMELPEVFEASHELAFKLIEQGWITGLRIDHPDGLWNPRQYFARVQEQARKLTGKALYVVAEKILSGEEELPRNWPVHGTTGYDFLNRLNGLYVDSANEARFAELYRRFSGEQWDFPALVLSRKRLILEKSLISETRALFHRLLEVARSCREGLDLSRDALLAALKEILSAFPVYRSYVEEHTSDPGAADQENVRRATARAREVNPALDPGVVQFIENLLLLRLPADLGEAKRARQFVMRFQQLSGPATAKGLEDTAFYNFFQLVSLNEVGGEPDRFGTSPEQFHEHNRRQSNLWPHTLLATATHDTKRGEDARARINVLSEMPLRWGDAVARWAEMNEAHRAALPTGLAPDRNDEFLFYQALVGAWTSECRAPRGLEPLRERLVAYLQKAIKEAKRHTTWTEPNEPYESAVAAFVRRVLSESNALFLEDFQRFHQDIAFHGLLNSLSQTALKLMSPGVPDIYQGTELWDFNLVDPDNRRPVDYGLRRTLLSDLQRRIPLDAEGWPANPEDAVRTIHRMIANPEAGQIKLWLNWRLLALRRRFPELFAVGDYVPLNVTGARQKHLCAFARNCQNETVVVVAPRLVYGLTGGDPVVPLGQAIWKDTHLNLDGCRSRGQMRNWLTGEPVAGHNTEAVGHLFSAFPIAVLTATFRTS